MTIQKRSYRASEQYNKSDYGLGYETATVKPSSRLGELGLSVYREAIHDVVIDSVIDTIRKNCPSYVVNIRGEGAETHPAINIIEKRESRAIFCSLGSTAIQNVELDDVNYYLFYNVPSLRSPLKVEPDSVELFGGRKNSHDRVIGITIKGQGREQILQERCDVIDGFNGLVHSQAADYEYIKPKDIHLSLARIMLDTPPYVVDKTLDAARESLSKINQNTARESLSKINQMILKKATIYYSRTNTS
ncbi:MAG: hypothetical protein WCK26_04170 [Candidatus Saccharibacteria bacterium]